MRIESKLDIANCVLLAAATLIVGLLAYHPYFFGDELVSFSLAQRPGASFWSVFSGLNSYKPRLLMNGVWALGASLGAPRYVFMLITVSAIAGSASLIYYLARVQFAMPRWLAWIAGGVVVTSRFSMLAYYDYLSGTIESLSLLCFLVAVAFVIAPSVFPRWQGTPRWALTVVACVLAVFVHERYLAGVAALGLVLMARGVHGLRSKPELTPLWHGGFLLVVPAALFVLTNAVAHAMPLDTGTAAMPVSLSAGTFERAALYLGNVFLGLNGGYDWLVGSLRFGSPRNDIILSVCAAVLAAIYAYIASLGRKEVEWRRVMEVGLVVCAMVLVASLPDWSRQEGRWMTPVLALAVVAALFAGRARVALLTALLAVNVVYFAMGSWLTVSNVVASNTARAIAAPLNALRPQGMRGIVLNAPDSGAQWALGGVGTWGGSDGYTFSRLNFFNSPIQVSPGTSPEYDHDFGLYYTGVGSSGRPEFAYLDQQQTRWIRQPGTIPANGGLLVGGETSWGKWNWSGPPQIVDGAVVLRPGVVGTTTLPVAEIANKLIIYRARALESTPVPMRLQVNWSGADGRYLGAFIRVVDVSQTTQNYAAWIAPPPGATRAMVYANLHDGATASVALDSIRVLGTSR